MKEILGSTEHILNSCVSGFHQYVFQEPVHLTYVSQNLCDMLGYTSDELLSEDTDLYAAIVHPADRERYFEFIRRAASEEQTLTEQYRVLCRDLSVMYVSDTLSSKRLDDGTFVGYSVLTDITSVKEENSNLSYLNDTIPCGFVRYTCEKQPRVTYVNDRMLKILGADGMGDGYTESIELYKGNIYLMIPMEERRKFSHFLSRVYEKGTPVSGEISVLRFDGTKARIYGWVTKFTNEQGEQEFQSVCMDVTERYRSKKASETEQYLKALSEVYDKIFEYDFSNRTVKYVHGSGSDTFGRIQNIPMQLEEATEQWIQNSVLECERGEVHEFFKNIFSRQSPAVEGGPAQIRFHSASGNGEIKKHIGIFLEISPSVSLFCTKSILDDRTADDLRNENISLKSMNESMQELVMRFTEGVVAFEVDNDSVKPLYASDNVCKFFGYTKEEWIALAQTSHSIKKFVSLSGVAYEDFEKLLETGESEFTYFDITKNAHRRIKAICSQKSSDGNSPRYVMLYNIDGRAEPSIDARKEDKSKIYIRTFGYFDVFVNEKPIAFRNKKSKELFALLVDRRGGYVSSEEAISFLWEDEAVNAVTLARYRKVALRLKNILEEYAITDIVESVDGKRRIVTDKVRCDLYDYLSQKEEYSQLFKGSYLTNYSWGETTLGELLNEHLY